MKRSPLTCWITGFLLSLLLGTGKSALGQVQEQAQQSDPKAEQIMREAIDYLNGLDSFRVKLSSVMTVEALGRKDQTETRLSFALRRPDRFALTNLEGMMGGEVICDGDSLYTHMGVFGTYTVTESQESINDMLSGSTLSVTALAGQGAAFFLMFLIPSGYEGSLQSTPFTSKYLGIQEIDGEQCHQLRVALLQDDMEIDLNIWISADGPPLVRQMVPDMSKMIEMMAERMAERNERFQGMAEMKTDISLLCSEWEVNIALPDSVFEFTPPTDAERSASLMPTTMPSREPDEMLDEPAPRFKLDLLGGNQVDLADHLGKEFVILDFWATWCGPCRSAMPLIIKVAEEYEEKEVVLYGVNLRESPEEIRKFLIEEGLDLSVVLDRDGKTGNQYGADSIPRTVLINKTGTIRFIHVGFSPDLDKVLRTDLDSLLASEAEICTEWDVDPEIDSTSLILPDYPENARKEGIEGTVTLLVVIDEEGRVTEATIINSEPIEEFGPAAREAVLKWIFSPALKEGKPVKVRTIQKVEFSLAPSVTPHCSSTRF